MKISELIRKLEEERRKYGDIRVYVHMGAAGYDDIKDVVTFGAASETVGERAVWLSDEAAR
jgi:phage terminase large subunit-like protein